MCSFEAETTLWTPTHEHVVVCVDDEAPVLGALRRLLRGEPYELRSTAQPEEAMDWVRDEPVSLLLADQRMPEMSGTELIEKVRNESPETLRVILTGYPDMQSIRHRDTRLIRRLITKPWSDEDLKKTIRLLLRERELKEKAKEQEERGTAPRPPPEREPGGSRVLVRLECRGRRCAEALEPLEAALREPECLLDGMLIELEHLPDLREAYSALLTELAAQVLVSGVRVTVHEPHGLARLFFNQVFGTVSPITVLPVHPNPPDEEPTAEAGEGQGDPYR